MTSWILIGLCFSLASLVTAVKYLPARRTSMLAFKALKLSLPGDVEPARALFDKMDARRSVWLSITVLALMGSGLFTLVPGIQTPAQLLVLIPQAVALIIVGQASYKARQEELA